MVYQNVLDVVGNTSMIELRRMSNPEHARVLVKYEGLNVGGSIKTRTALNMIEAGEKAGRIHKDTIIVEPTSGNQGIGLALIGAVRGYKTVICDAEEKGVIDQDTIIVEPTSGNQGIGLALVGAVKGYRTIIIMPDSVSEERRLLVKHYGAEVVLVHDDGDIGACIDECLQTALRMAAENPNIYVPQQFTNPANPEVHRNQTAEEILAAVDGPIDGFCSGIGTGGTITGIGQVLKKANPQIEIWAVEPENAAILSGGSVGTHLQMGIGDGLIPDILDRNIYDDIYIVTDEEAIQTSKDLARKEGLMCGISSGTNVAAALKLAEKLGKGKTVVTVLPDTAERYFSTPLFGEE